MISLVDAIIGAEIPLLIALTIMEIKQLTHIEWGSNIGGVSFAEIFISMNI